MSSVSPMSSTAGSALAMRSRFRQSSNRPVEYAQSRQPTAMLLAAGTDELLEGRGHETAGDAERLEAAGIRESFLEEAGYILGEPLLERNGEALLGTTDDLGGNARRDCPLQQDFGLARAHAPLGRNPAGELHERSIEQRNPCLQRREHRHAIDLGEDVSRQIGG